MPHDCPDLQVEENVWSLKTEQDVAQFVEHMSSHNAQLLALRRLEIAVGRIGAETAEQLESLFYTHAKSMCIYTLTLTDAEFFLESTPGMADALAEFTSLKTLSMLTMVKDCGAHMLRELESELVDVKLDLDGEDYSGSRKTEQERAVSNPIFLLRNSEYTLQSLEVSGPHFADFHSEVYPDLRCLTLDCVGAMPATYDLFHAYPDLYEFTIKEDSVFMVPSRMQGVRERNQEDQREYGSWEEISWVTAPLPTLYMLGLRCTVTILHLTAMSELEANLLGPVLADMSATLLTLTTSCERILDNQSILTALNQLGRQRECHALTLELKIRPSDSVETLHALWKRMKRELSDVRIRKFELRIDCDDISQEQDGADGWGNKQALMTYLGALRLSLRRLAFQFGDAIYSAVYVIIGMTGNPLCPDDAEVELEYQYQDRS